MSTRELAPFQSDFYVELESLADTTTGNYLSDATVTVTIFDKGGNSIAGALNVPAPYVTASNGVYRALIPHTAALILNTLYDVDTFVQRGGVQLHLWQEILITHLPAALIVRAPQTLFSL